MRRYSLNKKSYVLKDKKGKVKKVVSKARSIRADRRKKVSDKNIPKTKSGKAKSGYGHLGDYKKKRKFLEL